MNVYLLTAGILAVAGAAFHGIYGYVLVPRRVDRAALPATPFGDERLTRWMIGMLWHFLTLFLAASGGVLVVAAFTTFLDSGALRLIAAFFAGLLALWLLGGGPVRRLRHPGWLMLAAVSALTFAGTV